MHRIDPRTGDVVAIVALPDGAGVEVTACAFGGEQLDQLYAFFFTRESRKRVVDGAGKQTNQMRARFES